MDLCVHLFKSIKNKKNHNKMQNRTFKIFKIQRENQRRSNNIGG